MTGQEHVGGVVLSQNWRMLITLLWLSAAASTSCHDLSRNHIYDCRRQRCVLLCMPVRICISLAIVVAW